MPNKIYVTFDKKGKSPKSHTNKDELIKYLADKLGVNVFQFASKEVYAWQDKAWFEKCLADSTSYAPEIKKIA